MHFERPRYCEGWAMAELNDFLNEHNFEYRKPDGCRFGMSSLNPWKVASTSPAMAQTLDDRKCICPPGTHIPCLGGRRPKSSAEYPEEMAEEVVNVILNAVATMDDEADWMTLGFQEYDESFVATKEPDLVIDAILKSSAPRATSTLR